MRARMNNEEMLAKYTGEGTCGGARQLAPKDGAPMMQALNSVYLHRLTCNGRLGCCSQLHAAPGVLRSASRTRENGLRRLQEIKALRRLNDTEARP